jgi:ubiquinone/menaquinone biosynthesis C-methylase UbiE
MKIDLGCGLNKKAGFKGADILHMPGVDYIIDLEIGLSFLKDDEVEMFHSSHFLEHIENLEKLMTEIHRTLRPEGICEIVVPHFSNPYYYSDHTHKRFFGLYSFDYFSNESDKRYKRKVPCYSNKAKFRVVKRRLVFKSPQFPVLHVVRKYLIGRFFNISPWFQELYEAFFSNKIACNEIHFILKPIK